MLFRREKVNVEPSPLDKEIDSVIKSLESYSADTEDYSKAVGNLERLVALKKDICGEDKKTKLEAFKDIMKKLFENVTDPRVIVGVFTSVVYIWWGRLCMYYDQEGHIPPNRMMGNGPRPPKVF